MKVTLDFSATGVTNDATNTKPGFTRLTITPDASEVSYTNTTEGGRNYPLNDPIYLADFPVTLVAFYQKSSPVCTGVSDYNLINDSYCSVNLQRLFDQPRGGGTLDVPSIGSGQTITVTASDSSMSVNGDDWGNYERDNIPEDKADDISAALQSPEYVAARVGTIKSTNKPSCTIAPSNYVQLDISLAKKRTGMCKALGGSAIDLSSGE